MRPPLCFSDTRKPPGSSSIFLPCFSCSPPTLPRHHSLLLSRVAAAWRPGSQEQLVCLPALLTTANLWREATFTSLHTAHTTLKPALRVLPCSRDPGLQHWPCTSINPAPRWEFFFHLIRGRAAEEVLATAPRLLLYLTHREPLISFLWAPADSYEGSARLPPTRIFREQQKRGREKEGTSVERAGKNRELSEREIQAAETHAEDVKRTRQR